MPDLPQGRTLDDDDDDDHKDVVVQPGLNCSISSSIGISSYRTLFDLIKNALGPHKFD